MSKRARHLHRERCLAGVLLGILCLVWPLAAWHELTTQHEVCAEHGEILDVARGADGAEEFDGPRLVGQSNEEHEQCHFAPLAQPASGATSEPVPCVAPAQPTVAELFVEPPRVGGIPRYLLAPKHSPPIGRAS